MKFSQKELYLIFFVAIFVFLFPFVPQSNDTLRNSAFAQEKILKMRISVILLRTESEAYDILFKLLDGADFAELARQYSIAPGREEGGDMGYFAPEGMMKELSIVAYNLRVGEFSRIIETDKGYFILLKTDEKYFAKEIAPSKLAKRQGSDKTQGIFLWLFSVILPGLVWIVYYFSRKSYNEGLKEVCERMGLLYSPKAFPAPEEELRKFNLFSAGIYGFFPVVMEGSKGSFNVAIFEYSPKKTSTFTQIHTVFLFQSDQFNLPHFKLSPLNTTAGIKFNQFPKFSLQYHLACSEEKQIRRVFNTKVLSFFENQFHKFLSAEGLKTRLLFYKPDMRIAPEKIREFYDEAHLIAEAFLQSP